MGQPSRAQRSEQAFEVALRPPPDWRDHSDWRRQYQTWRLAYDRGVEWERRRARSLLNVKRTRRL